MKLREAEAEGNVNKIEFLLNLKPIDKDM